MQELPRASLIQKGKFVKQEFSTQQLLYLWITIIIVGGSVGIALGLAAILR